MKKYFIKHYSQFFIIFVGFLLIFKNLMLQSYIAGSDHFALNLILGAKSIGFAFILELAVYGLFLSFAFLFKGKGRYIYVFGLLVLVTTLCIVDSCYTRFFQGAPSVYWLLLPASTANVSTLKLSLYFSWFDLLYIIDIPFIILMLVKGIKHKYFQYGRIAQAFNVTVCVCVAVMIVPLCIPTLVKKVYKKDNSIAQIANFTVLGYHVWDIIEVFELDDIITINPEIQEEIDEFYRVKNENLYGSNDTALNEYFGKFKKFNGYQQNNLIYVQIESLETFVLGNSIDGQEITPNLNRYLKNSYYFDNLCEQVKNGNSSDCDLMQLSGMLPVAKGISFTHYEDSDYYSLPELMQSAGYNTVYCHGDNSDTWNYKGVMGHSMGFMETNFEIPGEELIGGYKADSLVLEYAYQRFLNSYINNPLTMEYVILASSHLPFIVPEEYIELELDPDMDYMVAGYLHAVHYVDKCIGEFMNRLDVLGALENTSVVFLGDHGGIHKYAAHRIDDMEEQYPWMGNSSNYRVPYFIYNKHLPEQKTFNVLGGQVDVYPTTAYLMGIDPSQYMNNVLGRVLVNTNRNYAFLSNDSFVGDLTEEEYAVLSKSYYLSDMMIRSKYFGSQSEKENNQAN